MRPHPWIGRSDDVRLGVLTEAVPPELVDAAVAECGVRGAGALSPRFMVYFTLALALFHQDSCDDVAEDLVGALEGMSEAIPNRSNLTRARQRLGPAVLAAVFRRVAGPVAPAGLAGSFWRGMRLVAVDGFVLDVPDSAGNRAAFGGPSDARGLPAGFPQVRVVTMAECGTHASIDARIGGFDRGEQELAVAMASSAAGMLVIMDRAFPGVRVWQAFTGAGAHVLIRARSTVAARPEKVLADGTYLARMRLGGNAGAGTEGVVVRVVEYRIDGGEVIRLLTDLLDPGFAAAELAGLYHERWEAEGANRQIKTFQRGPAQLLRSGSPDLVRQEIWAHLTVHHCLNQIIVRLAEAADIDPDRVSFVKVLKHVRRSVIRQTKDAAGLFTAFLAELGHKLRRKLDAGPRRLREAQRIIKRPDSKYARPSRGRRPGPTRRIPPKTITLNPAMLQ